MSATQKNTNTIQTQEFVASRRSHTSVNTLYTHTEEWIRLHKVVAGNVKIVAHNRRLEFDQSNFGYCHPWSNFYQLILEQKINNVSRFDHKTAYTKILRSHIWVGDKNDDLTCWYVAHFDDLAARSWRKMMIFVDCTKKIGVSQSHKSVPQEAKSNIRSSIPWKDRSVPFWRWTGWAPAAILKTRLSVAARGGVR